MRLSEIMGNMDLAVYPQIGLVMFLTIFLVVVARILNRKNQPMYDEASLIPLSDSPVTPRSGADSMDAGTDADTKAGKETTRHG